MDLLGEQYCPTIVFYSCIFCNTSVSAIVSGSLRHILLLSLEHLSSIYLPTYKYNNFFISLSEHIINTCTILPARPIVLPSSPSSPDSTIKVLSMVTHDNA